MKVIKCMVLLLAFLPALMVKGQSETETVKKSFTVKNEKATWFAVCNIEGNIEVEAHDENTIEIEVQKQISGNQSEIKQGMEEVKLDFAQGDGFVRARFTTPNNQVREKDDPLACGWDWNQDRERVNYRARLDYKVKVPRNISVKISTVNNSDLYIKGVKGEVYANNVNGDVRLIDVESNTKASTVNGKIEVNYLKMPTEFAEFQTVNGEIEIFAPANLGAIYNFESQWGEVYSDFDFSQKLSPKLVANKGERGGTKYKIDNSNSYQVGSGGPEFSFKTLNGDIRVMKAKK
ncbi:hypothetical protein EV198_3018 [Roseivirga ehrenbergii]|nr:hypothetical protein EV198_3018 [Roseivirga ehrenbergii]